MYGQDFWERVSWQQVCEFLRYGSEDKTEAGSLQERDALHERAFFQAVDQFWRDILATDWSSLPGVKADFKIEDLSESIMDEMAALKRLSFEAGFLAGLKMGREPLG